MYEGLRPEIEQTQMRIGELKLPPVKKDILKITDAGPGVGYSNIEARYRDAEMARILNPDRVNRVHRARDDSGQNEDERSNEYIYILRSNQERLRKMQLQLNSWPL
jgi:hypothetical protein